MTKHVEIELSPRDRFMKAAKAELAKFEKRDRRFRKEKRDERAELVRTMVDAESH